MYAFVPLPLDGLVYELEVPASFVVVLNEQSVDRQFFVKFDVQ